MDETMPGPLETNPCPTERRQLLADIIYLSQMASLYIR